VDLLLAIGVPPKDARADAEGIEHHVSPATLAAFARFLTRTRPSTGNALQGARTRLRKTPHLKIETPRIGPAGHAAEPHAVIDGTGPCPSS
jgi:Mn-dependent DtxR family transcriptional regulator